MATKPKPPTITTVAQANSALERLGEVERELEHRRLALKDQVAELAALAARGSAPMEVEAAALRNALEAFAEQNRRTLIADKNIGTAKLDAGEIGWAQNPLTVEAPEDKVELKSTIDWLLAKKWKRFLRTKHELDKAALKKEPDVAAKVPGVRLIEPVVFVCRPVSGEVRR